MVKRDITGGIKIALSKGQKLEDIMQSFYNAGYKKEDIEQAVRELFSETSQFPQPQLLQPVQKISQPITQQKIIAPLLQSQVVPKPQQIQQMPVQTQQIPKPPINMIPSPPIQTQPQKEQESDTQSLPTLEEIQRRYQSSPQSVSTTVVSTPKQVVSSYPKKNKSDPVNIILIIVLALLLGVLVSIFIFRTQIIGFLNKLV